MSRKRFNPNMYSEMGSLPVCGVYATAVAAKIDFVEAWNRFAVSKRSNWKGALYNDEILKEMRNSGVQFRRCCSVLRHQMLKNVINEKLLDRNKTYIVFTTRHVQIVQGLYVIDQGSKKNISDYRWARKRIEAIYEITNFGDDQINDPKDVIANKGNIVVPTSTPKKYSKWEIAIGGAAYYIKMGNNREQILQYLKIQGYSHNSAMTIYYNARKVLKNG